MTKIVVTFVFSLTTLLFLQNAIIQHESIFSWSDLGIVEQIQIITGVVVMVTTSVVASIIFRSVWIRKGYEGTDDKLEGKEVAMMLSHIISFICLLIFEYLITFSPYMKDKFPDYAFWICASGFVGPEVYLLVTFLKKLKAVEKPEPTN